MTGTDHTYLFKVRMSCGGCSGAVDRVLKKLDGVKEHKISLEDQSVRVVTDDSLSYDAVHEKIAKTGKEILEGKDITAEE